MSTQSGNPITPKHPTFAGPEGYSSTTLEVKNASGSIVSGEQKNERLVTRKGSLPGTFVARKPEDKIALTWRPLPERVAGLEIKKHNLEKEENAKLGEFLKKEGFNVDVEKGSVQIPTEYIREEELRALIPLSQEFALLKSDINKLSYKLTDGKISALLLEAAEKVEHFIEDIKASPTEEKLNQLQDKLEELSKAKAEIDGVVQDKERHHAEQQHLLENLIKIVPDLYKTIAEAETVASDERLTPEEKKNLLDARHIIDEKLKTFHEKQEKGEVTQNELDALSALQSSLVSNIGTAREILSHRPAASPSPATAAEPEQASKQEQATTDTEEKEKLLEEAYSRENLQKIKKSITIKPNSGQIVIVARGKDNAIFSYEIGSFNKNEDTFTLKKVPGGDTIKLTYGKVLELLARQEVNRQLERGTFAKKENTQEEKVEIPPLKDFFTAFNAAQGFSPNAALSWVRRWVESGKVDEFRKEYGNISIDENVLAFAKRALPIYIEGLRLPGLSKERKDSIIQTIEIYAGILVGVQHEKLNNIENFIDANYLAAGNLEELEKEIESIHRAQEDATARSEKRTSTPTEKQQASPSPVSTKEQPLPPNVRETWPRHITHKPKEGWTYTHNGKAERLSDTESWNAAEANIKPIFDEYFKFITEGNSSEQGKKVKFFTDVIKLKNEVVGFLNAKDPESARKYAEALKGAFEEQKRAWEVAKKKEQQAGSVESSDKKYNTEKELITERVEALKKVLSEDEIKTLLARVDDLEDAYQELRKHVVRQGSEDSPYKKEAEASFTEELKKLTEALKEKEVEHAEKLRTLRKEGRKKEGTAVLRGAFYKKQMNARHTINKVIDASDKKNREERERQEKRIKNGQEEKKVEMVEITEEFLDRWHELAGRFHEGDNVPKDVISQETIFISYNRMFKKNQDTFLGLYSTPEYDKEENRIKYVSNKRFHMGTEQEKKAIRKVFELHNLHFVDPTKEERRESERQEKEQETSSKKIFRAVYRPAHDKQKSLAEKGKKLADLSAEINAHPENKGAVKTFDKTFTSYRKEYESASQPQQMAEQTLHADVARYESVKSKRVRSDLPDTLPLSERASVRFGEMEKNLDNLMNDMLATKTKESHQKFIRALESYEKDVETRVHAKREEGASPKTKEEREKKAEALKKIDAIIEKRIEEAGKKADLKWGEGNGRIRKAAIILVALAGGATGAIGTYQFLKDTKSVEEPPRVESPTEQKKSMDDYVASYAKDLLKDIGANMSIRDLAAKEASLLVNKDKPSSIDNVLTMDARKVLYTEGVYNMSEEQQKQLSDMLRKFQNLYEATKAAAQAKAIANGTPFTYSPPNDFEPGYQTTVKDYMEKIIAEVKKADQ